MSGQVQAVIFDWAGTVIDHGSRAPAATFIATFASRGVTITEAEARAPMGLPKRDHLWAIGGVAHVAAKWQAIHGRPFDDAAVDDLYATLTASQVAAVSAHADLIPGVASVVADLRRWGVKIGSTTGYPRAVMEALFARAREAGFAPEVTICADDLPVTRPSPLGVYRVMADLGVWPAHTVVKVDDTVPGLWEGRHAGCWTVGVSTTGNEAGMSADAWANLPPTGREEVRARARRSLSVAFPDFVIDGVADLPGVLAEIGQRLARGGRPTLV